MTDGVAIPERLARVHLTEATLMIRLRRAGVRHLEDVQSAIVEADGSLTVVRKGEAVDPELLVGVQ
jgi:uncharacterized membrane protein YcaP (DUF421 family)